MQIFNIFKHMPNRWQVKNKNKFQETHRSKCKVNRVDTKNRYNIIIIIKVKIITMEICNISVKTLNK